MHRHATQQVVRRRRPDLLACDAGPHPPLLGRDLEGVALRCRHDAQALEAMCSANAAMALRWTSGRWLAELVLLAVGGRVCERRGSQRPIATQVGSREASGRRQRRSLEDRVGELVARLGAEGQGVSRSVGRAAEQAGRASRRTLSARTRH